MKILVIGIGQSLRGDDSAGLEAVRLWQTEFPENADKVTIELNELPGLSVLDSLNGMDAAVIIDAINNPDMEAGTVVRLGIKELAGFGKDARSAHGWGVAETLALGQAVDSSLSNCQVAFLGITGKQFNPGSGLSPKVKECLEKAAMMINKEVEQLLKGSIPDEDQAKVF